MVLIFFQVFDYFKQSPKPIKNGPPKRAKFSMSTFSGQQLESDASTKLQTSAVLVAAGQTKAAVTGSSVNTVRAFPVKNVETFEEAGDFVFVDTESFGNTKIKVGPFVDAVGVALYPNCSV